MSAFEVSKTHIDALVSAALFSKRGALSWYWQWEDGEPRHRQRIDHENAAEVGATLWAENAASVGYRYHGSTGAAYVADYEPRWLPGPYNPVAVLKAVQCYEYQACEHPGWHGSEAEAFCRYLAEDFTIQLDGYDAAAWAIGYPSELSTGIKV